MVSLYVTSVEEGAGKTTIGAGLGKYLRDSGKKVGFCKPIIGRDEPALAENPEPDALFMKQILDIDEPAEAICVVMADWNQLSSGFKEAYAKVASGKDVVITEGPCELGIVGALDARVIAVESYSDNSPRLQFIDHYKGMGKHLLGVVFNKVPVSKFSRVQDESSRQLKGSGIDILGVIPEDRGLFTLTVGELADCVRGKILDSGSQLAELVDNIMIGAMAVDPGPTYFERKENKAVVIRSNRPDMQMAALETSVRCLVLCGDTPPIPAVLYSAEAKNVPVILTETDISAVIGNIEAALGNNRFRQEKKLPRLTELMGRQINVAAVYKGLGLAAV